jgi:galactofuranosylgalactofuranosylrhamnosyl-N-acetylglucosaminyl-diphospho-decaprenol beta-1,5/1,6-galactofuranosyltransferase
MLPLTVIICTYHREKTVSETLELLFGPKVQSTQSVDLRVLLIDQGRTLQRTDFPPEWNLRVIHQDNFGGAGGFTRGMIEAMDEDAGWILLMDDDATPDPASFPTLADYIRDHAPDTRFALHGAMFSSEEPDTIYEAGASIKEPKGRNFDIVQRLRSYKPSTPLEKDPKLWENMEIDYGAWWFFSLHTDSIREVGLPLPLFIRGDDREYGLRLKAAGIPTVPLPGLRIWHTAQGVRADAWPMFFDQRNKLISHDLHRHGGRWSLAARMFYGGLRDILSARYDLARLSIEGIAAYLEGPHALSVPPKASLSRAREAAQPCADRPHFEPTIDISGKVGWGRLLRLIMQLLVLNGLLFPAKKQQALPVARIGAFDWLHSYRLPAYGLADEKGGLRVYSRSRGTAGKLFVHLAVAVSKYALAGSGRQQRWRQAATSMQTAAFWQNYLSMEPAPKHAPSPKRPQGATNSLLSVA